MKENKNEPAYPTVCDALSKSTHITEQGLTKLELISAMCLQGLLANSIRNGYTEQEEAELAIRCAKELLKQLEADND